MSSSSDSVSDFDMDMGDTGEGVEIKVQASVQQSMFKTHAIVEESEPDMGIEEDNMEDWDEDSEAPSIYKRAQSEKSLSDKPPAAKKQKYFHLFDEKPKKRIHNFDVKERFYKHQEKVKEKIEKLTEIVKSQEIEECSFKPTILNKNKTRTVGEFLEHVQKCEDVKKDKLKLKLEEQDLEVKKIRKGATPKICKGSKRIVERLEVSGIEKLSKAKQVALAMPDLNSYKPSVNLRSKELFREKKVEELLYEDALRRASRTEVSTPTAKSKYASMNSERFLLERFQKEFEEHFSYLDIEGTLNINYTKFTTLLYNMGFLSRSSSKISQQKQLALEIWTLIGGEESNTVNFSNLQSILTCIMNYKDPSIPSHSNAPSLGSLINSTFCIVPSELKKLHSHFSLLFEERNFFKPKPEPIPDESFTEVRKKSDTVHEEKLMLEKSRLQENGNKSDNRDLRKRYVNARFSLR